IGRARCGGRAFGAHGSLAAALGSAGKVETMHLADHRVAADAAQLRSNLTGAQPVRPEFLEPFDPFISPVHAMLSLYPEARDGRIPHRGPGRPEQETRLV